VAGQRSYSEKVWLSRFDDRRGQLPVAAAFAATPAKS
jgi:hypothetical protein